jgi:hypothetical protein
MPPVHRGDDQAAAGAEPAAQVGHGSSRIGEVLEREARQHHVEGLLGKAVSGRAEVDDCELVEVGERHRGLVDVRTHHPVDPRTEATERGDPSAPGIEGSNRAGRPLLGAGNRLVKRAMDQRSNRWIDPEPGQEGKTPR